jgi:hypothetical protein
MKHFLVVAIVLALVVLSIPAALANDKDWYGPKVFDRDSVAYGRTQGEWMAAWDQWSFSLPIDVHPLFTDGDCSVGQTGPVWFLGGSFVAPWTRVRHCTIPYGKALFFPVIDWEDSIIEESMVEHPGDPVYQQIDGLRLFVETGLQGVSGLYCTVDGRTVRDFPDAFRFQSPAFGITLPDNNLWTASYGVTFPAGQYFPSVDDGWDVMLAPFLPGDHVVHFGSAWNDITYYLHVAAK